MATTTMSNIEEALGRVVGALTEENYEQSLANYRFLFELAQTYSQVPTDLVFDSIWKHAWRLPTPDDLFYPTSQLILRFASDAESDSILAPHSAGLRSRLCTTILREFLNVGLGLLSGSGGNNLLANLVAHGANLGFIEETAIRQHILQLLTFLPTLYNHQVDVLCVLFEIAGATFDAYTDPSAVDHCFELLSDHSRISTSRRKQIKVGELHDGSLTGAKMSCRGYFNYGTVVGRVCLLRQYSQPAEQSKPRRARKIPS
jgi:hypothetical protein